MKPDYSIIIWNMNALENLKIQLPVLTKLKNISYELIIVDNNSTDGGPEYIKKNYSNSPNLKLIRLKRNIGTAAVNVGFRHSIGKYIIYIGDMMFDEKTLKLLRKTLDRDSSIGIAIPYEINYFSKNVLFTGELISRTLYSRALTKKPKTNKLIEVTGSGVGLIKRETIKEVGNKIYDPDYLLYGEDIDLGLRIRLIGKRSVIVPDAKIYHMHISVAKKTFSRFHLKFLTERNLTLTFLRTFAVRNIILFFPYLLFTRLLGSLKDLTDREFQYFLGRNYALFWLLFHPFFVLKKRRVSQRLRKVKDSYIFKPFSEKAIFSMK